MASIELWARWLSLAGVVALTACGGGTDASAPGASGTTAVTGTASFAAVPSAGAAGLNYAQTTGKPIRGAVVELLDATSGATLATGQTDAAGQYSLVGPAGKTLRVRIKAQLLNSAWDVSVRDNTQGDALYVLDSSSFMADSSSVQRDVVAGSGWGASSYTGVRAAAPFAILDTVYQAQQKVLSANAGATFQPLKIFWSTRNVPSSGSVTLGQIGTTYFTVASSGGVTERRMYVLGAADVDTDEYDASVIAHEWGHYYQNVMSRDDSPGGPHGTTQLLDRRLAFSEGWANGWSGMTLNTSVYSDTSGAGQRSGFSIDVSRPGTGTVGWFNEGSLQYVLWTLNQRVGFGPIHAAMTGALRSTPAVTSIHAFAASLRNAAPQASDALNTLLASQSISTVNDIWGAGETNDGGLPLALPLYTLTGRGTSQVCVSNDNDPNREGNKLGSYAYLRLSVPAATTYSIRAQGASVSDPDIVVYQRGVVAAGMTTAAGMEAVATALAAGDAVIQINDYNASGSKTCFTVTVN